MCLFSRKRVFFAVKVIVEMIKKSCLFLFLFSSATSLFFVVVGLVRDAAVYIMYCYFFLFVCLYYRGSKAKRDEIFF